MDAYSLVLFAPVMSLLICAACIDLRARRIPNWLSFSLILSGIGQSFGAAHLASPANAMLGFLTGFGLTFALFAIGALGGGDVKLLAGVGAWLGPEAALKIFVIAAIVGMFIVLAQALAQGRLTLLFRNSALIALNAAHVGEIGVEQVAASGKACRSVDRPLPYAVPVMLATLLLLNRSYVGR